MNKFILQDLKNNYVNSYDEKNPDSNQHIFALNLLREYLDANGMKMPKPKWRYDEKDKRTWVYLPAKITRDNNKVPIRHKVVFNKDFKYGHLL